MSRKVFQLIDDAAGASMAYSNAKSNADCLADLATSASNLAVTVKQVVDDARLRADDAASRRDAALTTLLIAKAAKLDYVKSMIVDIVKPDLVDDVATSLLTLISGVRGKVTGWSMDFHVLRRSYFRADGVQVCYDSRMFRHDGKPGFDVALYLDNGKQVFVSPKRKKNHIIKYGKRSSTARSYDYVFLGSCKAYYFMDVLCQCLDALGIQQR